MEAAETLKHKNDLIVQKTLKITILTPTRKISKLGDSPNKKFNDEILFTESYIWLNIPEVNLFIYFAKCSLLYYKMSIKLW